MAYRFTNTDKWNDSWFSELSQLQMLLFIYLCDNCDIAGFLEINLKRWVSDLGSSIDPIKGALKGLQRGLIFSDNGDCLFIKNFLKHQKNLPLNLNNKAHVGIIKRFDLYKHKFNVDSIDELRQLEGGSKGLQSLLGNGNGKSNGKGDSDTLEKLLDFDYDEIFKPVLIEWFEYKQVRRESYKNTKSRQTFYNLLFKYSKGSPDIANEIIKTSFANNWAGIFEIKSNGFEKPVKGYKPNLITDD